jgi:hypothetical protein
VVTKDPLLFDFWSAINNVSFSPFFSFFLSLSLSLFASWQVPRVTDNESWVGGQRVVCTLFHETPMPTPFLHNSVPTHHPQLISLVQNCCNCSSRFHFRSRYYYSLGLSVFLGPTVIFYYYFLLFVIYLTKFVVYVEQMGYVGVHNSSKLKIWFKVKNSLILYILAKQMHHALSKVQSNIHEFVWMPCACV